MLQDTIVISPIGISDDRLTTSIRSEVQRIFGYPTALKPLLSDVDFAFDATRDQYWSTPILDKLAEILPTDALRVLALTNVDLFIPILTHVFGEAQLGGRACIVSLKRLGEGASPANPATSIHARTIKEALHELGHTFNLRHCPEQVCIMHYCRDILDVDRKTHHFCRHCHILLQDEIERLRRSSS